MKKYSVSHKLNEVGDFQIYTSEANDIFSSFDSLMGVDVGTYAFDDKFGNDFLKYFMSYNNSTTREQIARSLQTMCQQISPKLKCEISYYSNDKNGLIIIAQLTYSGADSIKRKIQIRNNIISMTHVE